MDLNIDWVKFVQLNIPQWWRRKRFVVWLMVLVSGVRLLHVGFLAWCTRVKYALSTTGQTIYLERALNDRFDYVNRAIWIETAGTTTRLILFNRLEVRPAPVWYNRWNAAIAYSLGHMVTYGQRVWRATIASPVGQPDAATGWEDIGPQPLLGNSGEFMPGWSFIVHVPTDVVFDESEMRALVQTHKQAGKSFTIQID